MNIITRQLSVKSIIINNDKLDKPNLLKLIATEVAAKIKLDSNLIFNSLLERENLSSTGFENGIAIPHCQLKEIKEFQIGLIINKKGVDFNALDGKKSKLFFYIVGPKEKKQEHIRILSSAARLFSNKFLVKEIMNANSENDIHEIILKSLLNSEMEISDKEKMLFQIAVSDESLFDSILEAAVTQNIESISILEGESAAGYLYHMPLFASFWSDRDKTSQKMILATVDKSLANSLIRQIQMIPGIENMESKYQLNAINLYFSSGKLGL